MAQPPLLLPLHADPENQPPPLTPETLLTAWTFDWWVVASLLVMVGLYLWGVWRLRARGDSWPLGRVFAWVGWAMVIGAVAWLALSAPVPPRLPALAALCVIGFYLVAPAFPVQAGLWLAPLLVLALPSSRVMLAWAGVEMVYALGTWLYLYGLSTPNRALPVAWFALSAFLVNVLSRSAGVRIAAWGPLTITDDGLAWGLALGARALAIGALAALFALTTDAVAFLNAAHQQARVPARYAYALMAGYRLMEMLPDEWRTIRAAQAVRAGGVHERAGGPAWFRSFGRASFGLLVVALRRGQQLAEALEARGLGRTPRTIWRPVRWGWRDGVLLAVALAVAAAVAAGVLAR